MADEWFTPVLPKGDDPLEPDVLYVVVNASDPERHEVALCSTKEYADQLAIDMHKEHGWLYEVVEERESSGASDG